MGGVDKGLQLLHGKPMVAAVLARLAPQVDEILINANQNLEAYARVRPSGRAGRDRRLRRAARRAACRPAARRATPLVLTVPCDSPFLPSDLRRAPANGASDERRPRRREDRRPAAPGVLARARVGARAPARFLAAGGRKIDAWYATLQGRRSAFRRRGGRLPQHQHARGAGQRMSDARADRSAASTATTRRRCASTRRARRSAPASRRSRSTERVPMRDALGRVLAQDIVPGHRRAGARQLRDGRLRACAAPISRRPGTPCLQRDRHRACRQAVSRARSGRANACAS